LASAKIIEDFYQHNEVMKSEKHRYQNINQREREREGGNISTFILP
jgi:hypothetical protein